MKLFEIDAKFNELFDEETGEIFDLEALEKLEMERDRKLRNIICLYKKLSAEADALKTAESDLKKRRSAKENSAERLLNFIDSYMRGEDFECTEGKLAHRKSKATEMTDEMAFLEWSGRFEYGKSTFTPNKKDIADAIKAGKEIPGWELIEKQNASIK